MWPSPSPLSRAPRRAGAAPSEVTISNRGNQSRPYRRLPTRRPGSDSSRHRQHCTPRARRCRVGSQIRLKTPRNHGPVVGSEHPRPHGWAPAHMRCKTTSCPKGTSKPKPKLVQGPMGSCQSPPTFGIQGIVPALRLRWPSTSPSPGDPGPYYGLQPRPSGTMRPLKSGNRETSEREFPLRVPAEHAPTVELGSVEMVLTDVDLRAPGTGYQYGENDPALHRLSSYTAESIAPEAPGPAATAACVSCTPYFGVGNKSGPGSRPSCPAPEPKT
jgi:hypothetical protein